MSLETIAVIDDDRGTMRGSITSSRRTGLPAALAAAALLAMAGCSSDAAGDGAASTSRSVPVSASRSVPVSASVSASASADAPATATDLASTTSAPITSVMPPTSVAPMADSTLPPTTLSPTTTAVASPTTPPADVPPTSVEPTAADLVLRADGIGTTSFGTPTATAVAWLGSALGAPADQSDAHFPTAAGDHFEDADGNAFATEFAGFACFANDLCVSFGGAATDSLVFLGWSYASSGDGPMPSPALSSADGVRPGVMWAAVATAVDIDENGCYGTGYGDASGIRLVLQSPDAWFGSMGVSPTSVPVTPDPATVTITQLFAGAQSSTIYDDC